MRAVIYRASVRIAQFVDRHALLLLVVSGFVVAVSAYVSQAKNVLPSALTSLPGFTTVAGALPGIASILKYAHDGLDKRRQQQIAIQTSDDAQRQARAQVQAAVAKSVSDGSRTLLDTRLELSLTNRSVDIDDPQRGLPGRGIQADGALPPDTPIKAVYDSAQGQLLILGAGGAGKTGIVVELAGALVQASHDDPTAPVPILLPLGSWGPTTLSLQDWLVKQMQFFYSINPLLGEAWITERKVIPLLDGLDTAGGEAGRACIQAINDFLDQTNIPIVVSSRTVEYESLGKKLRFHGAVEVQPLSQDEVGEYLKSPGLEGLANAVAADAVLRQLTTTPWFLGVAVTAYRNKVAGSVPTGGAPEELREHILDDYVQTCLNDPNKAAPDARYTPEATRRWLKWLARTMLERKQEVFFYDLMQADLLSSRREAQLATFGVAGAAGMVAGLLAFAGYTPIFGGLPSVFLSVVAGIVVGMAAYEPRITPTTKLRWSWGQLRSGLLAWLGFGPVFGLLAGLSVGAIVQLQGATVVWLGFVISGVVAGLCLGIFFALVGTLRNDLPAEPTDPGAAITSSLWTGLKGGAIMAAASALIAGLGGAFIVGLSALPQSANGNLTRWLVTGLVVEALAVGLVLGLAGVDPGVRRGLQRTWRTSVVITLGVAIVDAQVAAFMAGQFGIAGRFISSGAGATTSRAVVAGVLLAWLVGLGTGICHGTLRGAGTFLRHKALLALLGREGVIAPRYLLFLRHMSNVRLIERRGGGYEFLHRFLLEHFTGDSSYVSPLPQGIAPKPVAVDA